MSEVSLKVTEIRLALQRKEYMRVENMLANFTQFLDTVAIKRPERDLKANVKMVRDLMWESYNYGVERKSMSWFTEFVSNENLYKKLK